jgi:hypothetical protein
MNQTCQESTWATSYEPPSLGLAEGCMVLLAISYIVVVVLGVLPYFSVLLWSKPGFWTLTRTKTEQTQIVKSRLKCSLLNLGPCFNAATAVYSHASTTKF